MIYRNNEKAKPNPAGENDRAPIPLPKMDRVNARKPSHEGMKKPIPSTMGYSGKKIK